jgi:pyruvate/2-oxoglutarate dehydrogenase complex dihydrolipoamide acyltransferase (E2) component
MAAGKRRHHVQALVEIDVTAARERLRANRSSTGESLSTTAWIAFCLGRALVDHPELNVHRLGSRKVVGFDEVDVMILVEREIDGQRRGLPLVIRQVDRKTVPEIHREVRAAQGQGLDGNTMVLDTDQSSHWSNRGSRVARFYPLLPAWVRCLFWRLLARDGFKAKQILGTAGITAVGMFGHTPGWPLTVGMHTVDLAVGSIVRKPWVVGDTIVPREILNLAVLVDHDLVDGAPAARFVAHLAGLMESAAGLDLQ